PASKWSDGVSTPQRTHSPDELDILSPSCGRNRVNSGSPTLPGTVTTSVPMSGETHARCATEMTFRVGILGAGSFGGDHPRASGGCRAGVVLGSSTGPTGPCLASSVLPELGSAQVRGKTFGGRLLISDRG